MSFLYDKIIGLLIAVCSSFANFTHNTTKTEYIATCSDLFSNHTS